MCRFVLIYSIWSQENNVWGFEKCEKQLFVLSKQTMCVFVCEQWSYLFLLLDCFGRCGYDFYFKTRELKKKWLEQFEMAMWVTAKWKTTNTAANYNKNKKTKKKTGVACRFTAEWSGVSPRSCWKTIHKTSSHGSHQSCCMSEVRRHDLRVWRNLKIDQIQLKKKLYPNNMNITHID